MRAPSACVLLIGFRAIGGESGDSVDQPNLVGKIAEVLVASKVDCLTPRMISDRGKLYSYHLESVSYLGTMERGSERFILASALFVRSSARGSGYPPARGHGFLLCLSPNFHLISYCRLDHPQEVDLVGTELRRRQKVIGSFSASDLQRAQGFLIDGDDILPYPFSDTLTDPAEEQSSGQQGHGAERRATAHD